jgi:hypothetical protein
LKKLHIPGSLTTVGKYVFYKNEALEELTFGEGVTTIDDYAFSNAKSLKFVRLADSITTIGKQAFKGARDMESIVLGESVTTISNHAFYGWSNATIYTEYQAAPEGWSERWNSSYRPVVWGVTLDADGAVYSFKKTAATVSHLNEKSVIGAPLFEGKVFKGWTTVENGTEAEFAANELVKVADGTTLYAVWADVVAA